MCRVLRLSSAWKYNIYIERERQTEVSAVIMAAEVSSRDQGKREDAVTSDLLGSGGADGGARGVTTGLANNFIDLDLSLNLKVTTSAGCQDHHLDLLQKFGSSTLNRGVPQFNLLPLDSSYGLDLRLMGPTNPATLNQSSSVCTLEKVRSALERAGRESRCTRQQHAGPPSPPSSSSSITSSSSIKRRVKREDEVTGSCDSSAAAEGMTAAGCPRCLMYVLIDKRHSRCPLCETHVPTPKAVLVAGKKARVDLNFSLN